MCDTAHFMVWWEIVFMLVILKIPIVYLCAVIWWAIRAEPFLDEGTPGSGGNEPLDPRPWWRPPRRRRSPGPHGMPPRSARTPARPTFARGRVDR
jgi:hypothetical protein